MEAHIKNSFKKFPTRDWLANVGLKILSGSYSTDSFRFSVKPKSKNAVTCHLFAKHEDVLQILGPNLSDCLDLSHYDRALISGGGGAEFFISAKNKTAQWDLLTKALLSSPPLNRQSLKSQDKLNESNCPRSHFETQTNDAVATALSIINRRLNEKPSYASKLDPIKDYGFLVTFLMVRDVVGFKMPTSSSFLYRVFNLINKIRGAKLHKLPDLEIRQANELVFWIEVMFGHLFMNPGDHNKGLMFASRLISKRYRKVIQASLENPTPGSLIDRMRIVNLGSAEPYSDFNTLVVNIVMELVGSFQYLTGQAFAGVVETIGTQFSATLDPSENALKTFNAKAVINGRAMIDEALRHNSPTGFIFRAASTNFTYKGLHIAKGDLLCVLCDQAVKDPAVFNAPDEFCDIKTATQRQKNYLAFGSPDVMPSRFMPTENHHPCFGQYWGRSMILAMLTGLETLPTLLDEMKG